MALRKRAQFVLYHRLHLALQRGGKRGAHQPRPWPQKTRGHMRRQGGLHGLALGLGKPARQGSELGCWRAYSQEACPTRHLGPGRIGGAQACHQHGRLGLIEPGWRLAQQEPTGRRKTLHLAAHGHQIGIGLQDLLLAPVPLQRKGHAHGLELALDDTPRPGCPGQQPGQLHGDGGATAAPAPQTLPGAMAQCPDIHAMVAKKTLVLGALQHPPEDRRHLVIARPGEPALAEIHPGGMQHLPVAIQQHGLGAGRGLLNGGKAWRLGPRQHSHGTQAKAQAQESQGPQHQVPSRLHEPAPQGSTTSVLLGNSA